jgi:hypothetical protein
MNRRFFISFIFVVAPLAAVVFLLTFASPASAKRGFRSKLEHEPVVVQRIIRVEGMVEKPRVLFIVPRSKLWRGGFLNKSFKDDILSPVYPEKLIKQWARPLRKGG